jgi:hypothetical protein
MDYQEGREYKYCKRIDPGPQKKQSFRITKKVTCRLTR